MSHACGLEENGMPIGTIPALSRREGEGWLGADNVRGVIERCAGQPKLFRQLNVGVDEIIPHLQQL